MASERRKRLIRLIESVALGLVALDIAVYLLVIQPLRASTQSALESFDRQRAEIRNEEGRVKRLEWYTAALPGTEKQLGTFMDKQVQNKRKGFTRLAKLLRELAGDSNIDLSGFTFKPESHREEPLERISISLEAQGSFGNLMSFAHALETTDSDFIVIQDFDFGEAGKDTPDSLNLKLSAELYLTP